MSNLLLMMIMLLPSPHPGPEPNSCPYRVRDYDGRMSIYDPKLGGINCDDDCSTVAMGKIYPEMYEISGACVPELYGATIKFRDPFHGDYDMPGIFHCVDTGPAIKTVYYPWRLTCASWFDVLWPLTEEKAPFWTGWYLDYEVVEWGGAWNWYQEIEANQ
jgi:hypothetical protein